MGTRNNWLWQLNTMIFEEVIGRYRFYSAKSKPVVDLKKLRPVILKRIEERAKEYPIKRLSPVAHEVLRARTILYHGVSTLIQRIPVWACQYCPEVYIGENGHLIRTCGGSRHQAKNQIHKWVKGSAEHILVPVETFHLQNMFQNVIEHNKRFDYDRISAVVELCLQAGADPGNQSIHSTPDVAKGMIGSNSLSNDDMRLLARGTLNAWETLRSGVGKLLLVYPVKVCKHCTEVHVGPSGHKARLCGVFKYESWRGTHFWKKAEVDDLVPPKIVWHRRPQDPPVLVDEGRGYYGHAPAVVDLCSKAGAIAPSKYSYMMKVDGLSAPPV